MQLTVLMKTISKNKFIRATNISNLFFYLFADTIKKIRRFFQISLVEEDLSSSFIHYFQQERAAIKGITEVP